MFHSEKTCGTAWGVELGGSNDSWMGVIRVGGPDCLGFARGPI